MLGKMAAWGRLKKKSAIKFSGEMWWKIEADDVDPCLWIAISMNSGSNRTSPDLIALKDKLVRWLKGGSNIGSGKNGLK